MSDLTAQKAFEDAGLATIAAGDLKDALSKFLSEFNEINLTGCRTHNKEGQEEGWVRMGQTLGKLRLVLDTGPYTTTSDQAFYRLFRAHGPGLEPSLSWLNQNWRPGWDADVVRGAAALCRLALGASLGWLNVPTGLQLDQLTITQDPRSTRSRSGSRQATLQHHWLSQPFSTSNLLKGSGLLPFSIKGLGLWDQALVQRDPDAKATEEAFSEAIADLGVRYEDACLELRISPYRWTRYETEEDSLGVKIIENTSASQVMCMLTEVINIQKHGGRCVGEIEFIWDDIAGFFDPQNRGNDRHNMYTPAEVENLQQLQSQRRAGLIDPHEVARRLPQRSVTSVLDHLRKNSYLKDISVLPPKEGSTGVKSPDESQLERRSSVSGDESKIEDNAGRSDGKVWKGKGKA